MYFYNSMILGFLAATCTSVAARALTITTRSTDVTCAGKFPKAGDGFAKRPDGCSSWSDNPEQVRDKWGSANFGGVCDDHDRCYYTIGANVDDCNNNFCSGLKDACRHAYCRKFFGTTVCEPFVTYGACRAIAETYCASVKAVAAGTYAKAQDLQRSYQACIAENGGITPPPLPPPGCINGQPEGATWHAKAPGTRCTENVYVCLNREIRFSRDYQIPNCIEI